MAKNEQREEALFKVTIPRTSPAESRIVMVWIRGYDSEAIHRQIR
ncbi:MAG: hypothetical protein METHP_00739 [Methanoregula sp. SKADARSKE-2]|nr:MAG: hypothetical protein METHP_00739 [Methanoregula sp. SKADARSKE-2]